MSRLVEEVDRLSRDTERRVTGLWDRVGDGTLDEPTFVKTSARTVNRANARATVKADTITAADLRAQTGRPHRPAGIKPINDQQRLEGSIGKVIKEKPITAKTPQEIQDSRRKRLGRLARNEPATAAQNATKQALDHHEGLIDGWVRALGGSAVCPLCQTWADGVVRSTKVHMVRHKGCRCMPRPVAKKIRKAKFFGVGLGPSKFATAIFATPGDEILVAAIAGRITRRRLQRTIAVARHPAATIFTRFTALEKLLAVSGIKLQKGNYLIHGSGLLEALDMRVAGDLDLIVHPDVFDEISKTKGWYVRMAGTNKDHPVLQHPDLDPVGIEISKAEPHNIIGGSDVTIRDLVENTVTIRGREFISPEQLTRMKNVALEAGAKVSKNKRDLAFLDGRLTWAEDVARFGNRLNASGGRASILERRALQLYGKGSFEINERLRSGLAFHPNDVRQIELMDRAIARQRTPHRVKVYRGLRMTRQEALELYADKIDTTVVEKSYLSTGLREQVARKYGKSGVYLELDVPEGTPGYFAPYRALAPEPTPEKILQLFGEDELLLPRNLAYHIKELVERPDGTILVRAEVVPARLRQPITPSAGRLFLSAERPAAGIVGRELGEGEWTKFAAKRMFPSSLRGGEVPALLEARSAEGKLLGRLTFVRSDQGLRIAEINVGSRHRRKGVASALMDQLRATHPGLNIDIGELSPEGRLWWEAYQARQPALRISPVRPSVTPPAPGAGPRMSSDLIPDTMIPKILERQLKVPGFEDLKRIRNPRAALEAVIQRQAELLLEVAERHWGISAQAGDLHAGWYPFAHGWINSIADAVGVGRTGGYAATAALSPSADWANNVAWAKRFMETFADETRVVVKKEWVDARYLLEVAKDPRARRRTNLVGLRLDELTDEAAAWTMRAWHDADPVKQLGGHAGFGNPANTAMPQSADNLLKAVKVLRDSSAENINRVLGGQKVRSFYNNLALPFDIDFEDVTVDTHHFGAANGIPWTTNSRFVSTKAGSINLTERPENKGIGIAGTYPTVTDATRQATRLFNERHGTSYHPDQFQSIVWEQWRAEFPSDFRSATLEGRIDRIRTSRARGHITPTEERRLIEAARRRAGAPTPREILAMYTRYDLAGRGRPTWTQLREELRRG